MRIRKYFSSETNLAVFLNTTVDRCFKSVSHGMLCLLKFDYKTFMYPIEMLILKLDKSPFHVLITNAIFLQ